jgi:hypothetical protein
MWSSPITGLDRPLGFQEVEAPRYPDNRHLKVVNLPALRTGRLCPHRKYSWYSFLLEAESTQGHSVTERIMSMKNSNDTIRNRTRVLLVCSATNCATTAPLTFEYLVKILYNLRPSDTRQLWIKFKRVIATWNLRWSTIFCDSYVKYSQASVILLKACHYVHNRTVAALSKAYVSGRQLAPISGSYPAVGIDICLLWLLCVAPVEACVTSRSLVQGSPTWCVCVV